MKAKYGPWAFINGGSEGIGAEIGNTLAAQGINICMVARNTGALEKQKSHLQTAHGIEVIADTLDMSRLDAIDRVFAMTKGIEIGFYAHVASFAPLGAYLDSSRERHRRAMQVNMTSLDELTWHFGSRMRNRKRGGILLCSSMAGLTGFPYNAQYAANKAYGRLLGEALWHELKPFNIDVLALTISEVSTPALLRSGSELSGGFRTLTPAQCVAEAFSVIGRKPSHVTGRLNRLLGFVAQHLLPKKTFMKLMAGEIARFKEPSDVH